MTLPVSYDEPSNTREYHAYPSRRRCWSFLLFLLAILSFTPVTPLHVGCLISPGGISPLPLVEISKFDSGEFDDTVFDLFSTEEDKRASSSSPSAIAFISFAPVTPLSGDGFLCFEYCWKRECVWARVQCCTEGISRHRLQPTMSRLLLYTRTHFLCSLMHFWQALRLRPMFGEQVV